MQPTVRYAIGMKSLQAKRTVGRYQLSMRGIFAYVALLAATFTVMRILALYSSIGATGAYPIQAGRITDILLPVAIGLVASSVAVAFAFLIGRSNHCVKVALWSFFVGTLFLPVLLLACIVLGLLGVLEL